MDVKIFILTRDRPVGLANQIRSVLRAGMDPEIVTVSDNSTDNECTKKNRVIVEQCHVSYRKRNEIRSVFDHIQVCANETPNDLIMLLHDDDSASPDILESYRSALLKVSNLDAVCGVVKINEKLPWPALKRPVIQEVSTTLLINQYTLYRNPFISAFPFYLFRTKTLQKALLNYQDLGLYSDFSILLEILSLGG